MAKRNDVGYEQGVLWVVARLVEMYDEPFQAAEILAESGVDIRHADEADMPYLEIVVAEPVYQRRVGKRGQSTK